MKWRVLVGLRAPGRAPERRQVTVQARDATAAAERAKWLFGGRERAVVVLVVEKAPPEEAARPAPGAAMA